MNKHFSLLLFILLLLNSCNSQTSEKNENTSTKEVHEVAGDTVKQLDKSIMTIFQDKQNVYWFGSWENGIYKYDGQTILHFSKKHGLPNNRIDEIKEDPAGNIYFISCHPKSTVVKFDGKSFKTITAVPSNQWKLQETDLWFRHAYQHEKVLRYDGDTLHELTLPKPPNLSNPYEIYSIYRDRNGNMWFGTNPVGVCRYNGKTFDWITEEDVTEFRDEGANGVRSITEDVHGDFWFNTEFRYRMKDPSTPKSKQFYERHASIGGLDGKKDSQLDEYLSTVRDNEDNLWFVTYRDGVWKYDGTAISHYEVKANEKNITLFCIYKDNNGELWLGSHENGAYKFNGKNFERFRY